jgi:opacity protein-like surface antigen
MYLVKFKDFFKVNIPVWEEADNLIPVFSRFRVVDLKTKKTWEMMRTSGKYHADVETISKEDTKTMLSVFPKDVSFEEATYRPVIVEISGKKYGAALMGYPHAGSLETKFKEKTNKRSGGFGYGTNWDYNRYNGTTGHFCLHFRGSIRHTDKESDEKAQKAIDSINAIT